jgi:hypothetical protein
MIGPFCRPSKGKQVKNGAVRKVRDEAALHVRGECFGDGAVLQEQSDKYKVGQKEYGE